MLPRLSAPVSGIDSPVRGSTPTSAVRPPTALCWVASSTAICIPFPLPDTARFHVQESFVWFRAKTDSSALAAYPHSATMISVFVSCHLDIEAVKKAVGKYKQIAGAKVNFDKRESLQLGAWRGSDTLPGPFRWSDRPVHIQLDQNWSEVHTKVNAQVGIWLSRRLSLKGRAEACAVHLPPDPLPIGCTSSA